MRRLITLVLMLMLMMMVMMMLMITCWLEGAEASPSRVFVDLNMRSPLGKSVVI